MINDVIQLNERYDVANSTLTSYACNIFYDHQVDVVRPAVIVVPGGAYQMVSKREGEVVAMDFVSMGFQAFVLNYSTSSNSKASYPEQLKQIACAVDYVKTHAKQYLVDANKVFAVGFSAGGHLVGNLAVDYQGANALLGGKLNCKPTAVGLGYPVINAFGHQDSFDNLLQGYDEQEKQRLTQLLALDKQVTKSTVPCFVWTTAQDSCVNPINSLTFAQALSTNGVKFELHVYPQGEHGLSNSTTEINLFGKGEFLHKNRQWLENCAQFFHLFC